MSHTFDLFITKSQLDHGGQFTINIDNEFIKIYIPPHSFEDQLFVFFHNNKKVRVITTIIDQSSLQNCWIEYSTYMELLNDYKMLKTKYDYLTQNISDNDSSTSHSSYNFDNFENSYNQD